MTSGNGKDICVTHSNAANFGALLGRWRQILPGFKASWYVGTQLAARDIRSTYRQNILGFVWILLPPIVTTALWIGLTQAGIANISSGGDMPYPVFVTAGTLLWSLFTDALNSPRSQVGGNMSTLASLNFPPESVIISGTIQLTVNFIVRLALLIAVALWFGYTPSIWFPGFLLFSGIIVMIGLSIGLLLVPFTIIYKDIGHMLTMGIPLLMYTAPIVFPMPDQGILRYLMLVNPLTYPVEAARACLEGSIATPSIEIALMLIPPFLILSALSWIVFRVTLPHLVERG